jgi:adenylate kinase
MSRGPRLVLLGKQGAGKGTQAVRLSERYGIAHVATGDLFRAAAAAGTPAGLEAERYMNRGDLVPDDLVFRIVVERFGEGDLLEHGFVFDGFPRTLRQAEKLEAALESHPIDVVINLDVPTDIVLDRIAGRRVCEKCGTTYHVHAPPKEDWTCDVCGGKVVQREDDTEEAVLRRLELYAEETVPIIDFYRNLGRLVVVDGTGDSDEVFTRLVEQVDQRLKPLQT